MIHATPLGDRHCWHQVTHRLGFISKAPKTKRGKQSLVAVYCGFPDIQSAGTFASWVSVHWGKSMNWDITIRPSQRLSTPFEVKIRAPKLEQLHALIAKSQKVPNNVIPMRKAS